MPRTTARLKDRVLAVETAGWADVAGKQPMKSDSLFWIASQSKSMTAGGLFSTAGDVARFCQMVFNGGQLGDHRYLSKAAVKEMTSRQTRCRRTTDSAGQPAAARSVTAVRMRRA